MSGIIAGFLSGVGETGAKIGADYIARNVQAQIDKDRADALEAAQGRRDEKLGAQQEARDTRLAAERKSEITLQDQLRRAPAEKAMGLIEQANATTQPVDDGFGGQWQQTPTKAEQLNNRIKYMTASGDPSLIAAASSLEHARVTQDENAQNRAQRSSEHADDVDLKKADLKIRQAAEGRLAKGTSLDNEIKTLTLNNAKRVDTLKKEFTNASPERKNLIAEEVQLLTGKDNDSYLPVPLKDAEGNITGYKVFDKKRGTWVEAAGAQPRASPGGRRPHEAFDSNHKPDTDKQTRPPMGPGFIDSLGNWQRALAEDEAALRGKPTSRNRRQEEYDKVMGR